jgi:decaprenylphospho-beta-D-erythro-pentofuranosid-2-ulose 2-reductase
MSSQRSRSTGRRVIVAGGTSEIALAILQKLLDRAPRDVALLGRSADALARAADGLQAAGTARAIVLELDAERTDDHGDVVDEAVRQLGGLDIAIVAIGALGERGGLPADIDRAVELLQVNFVGAGSVTLELARALREGGGGTLVVLSSVAAERPRRSNVVYGASKAGLDALAQGLADALREERVRVLVVRPGFVRTRMTRGLEPAPLSTDPQAVADVVLAGLDRGAGTVWAPAQLRWLMLLVRMLPRRLFRRMKM